jgi:glucose/arabinose dehydrogenase
MSLTATRVAIGLSQPDFATAPPGDAGRLFIVEKTGMIEVLDLHGNQIQPFLDLSGQVSTAGEEGVLGLAFAPDYATSGRFYVDLSNANGDTEIRSYQVSATNPNQADPAGGSLVMTITQPQGLTNHKGGWIGFGPDNMLYVATGDGGGAGDPSGNAQSLHSLLGKILRIDPSHDGFPTDSSRNYAIPADNPFVGQDADPEIWALGLRNPWRDSFDSNGTLHIADVGQDRWEELDIGHAGANYGWNVFEGPAVYAPGPVAGGTATPPIFSYGHDVGNAVIGGAVVDGRYYFADYGTGTFWSMPAQGGAVQVETVTPTAGTLSHPSSFGLDGAGHLYVTDLGGDVFRLL